MDENVLKSVSKIVQTELLNFKSSDFTNPHNLKFPDSLVTPPEFREYKYDDTHSKIYCLVAEEINNSEEGYKIVYDPDICSFGLAVESEDSDHCGVYLGSYGTFLETLAAM